MAFAGPSNAGPSNTSSVPATTSTLSANATPFVSATASRTTLPAPAPTRPALMRHIIQTWSLTHAHCPFAPKPPTREVLRQRALDLYQATWYTPDVATRIAVRVIEGLPAPNPALLEYLNPSVPDMLTAVNVLIAVLRQFAKILPHCSAVTVAYFLQWYKDRMTAARQQWPLPAKEPFESAEKRAIEMLLACAEAMEWALVDWPELVFGIESSVEDWMELISRPLDVARYS